MDVSSDFGGIRVSFLLDTFLSTAWMQEVEQRMEQLPRTSKEKYLGCRSENRLRLNRRDSDTLNRTL